VQVTVRDVPERSRYEASVDGRPAGFVAYERSSDRIVFTHTEVDDAFEGQGVGGALVRYALEDARNAHLSVVPLCPFVRSWIDRHPEYADLVAGLPGR
jgi:uncharacterized protein